MFPCSFEIGRGKEGLERSVEVLRQLEVFDDVTALIDSQPVEHFASVILLSFVNGPRCSRRALQDFHM
jgi:hypothetical protein